MSGRNAVVSSQWKLAQVCRRGDRAANQDRVGHRFGANGAVAVVCDGLGGHCRGEWAAEVVSGALLDAADDLLEGDCTTFEAADQLIRRSFAEAARQLKGVVQARDAQVRPLTTAVVAVARRDALVVGHLGDSRAYRFAADGSLTWRSTDHSHAQRLVEQGRLAGEALPGAAARNRLTRCIGIDRRDAPGVSLQAPLRRREMLVLCSDGLWERFDGAELGVRLRRGHLQRELEQLVEEAGVRAWGRSDNIAAVCLERRGGGLAALVDAL
jgi:serine/threonine protein phosphatase PrpC